MFGRAFAADETLPRKRALFASDCLDAQSTLNTDGTCLMHKEEAVLTLQCPSHSSISSQQKVCTTMGTHPKNRSPTMKTTALARHTERSPQEAAETDAPANRFFLLSRVTDRNTRAAFSRRFTIPSRSQQNSSLLPMTSVPAHECLQSQHAEL